MIMMPELDEIEVIVDYGEKVEIDENEVIVDERMVENEVVVIFLENDELDEVVH